MLLNIVINMANGITTYESIDELQEFYDENRNHLTYEGADRNPEKSIEYKRKVEDFMSNLKETVQEKIEEDYSAELAQQYAEKAGEMLAERVGEELENPLSRPGEGGKSPDFEKARKLLGE